MRTMNRINRPLPTFFKNREHLKKAFGITTTILCNHKLAEDDEGFCKISDLIDELKTKPELSYITPFHICELYIKDKTKHIFIRGTDKIKYKEIKYVQPPDTLYFGTLSNLASKMLRNGLKSSTKGYVKLYDSLEGAIGFASRFIKEEGDKISVIKVNSGQAFSEGMKFSTYKDHEYIVVHINKKFLEGIETCVCPKESLGG